MGDDAADAAAAATVADGAPGDVTGAAGVARAMSVGAASAAEAAGFGAAAPSFEPATVVSTRPSPLASLLLRRSSCAQAASAQASNSDVRRSQVASGRARWPSKSGLARLCCSAVIEPAARAAQRRRRRHVSRIK
ncbi:MAG: hypothetical protein IPM15_08375 [Betaproteobacteria bacterium]|nr:hypothetical protein [Betaproteobacteria bacterium]